MISQLNIFINATQILLEEYIATYTWNSTKEQESNNQVEYIARTYISFGLEIVENTEKRKRDWRKYKIKSNEEKFDNSQWFCLICQLNLGLCGMIYEEKACELDIEKVYTYNFSALSKTPF